MKNTIYIADDEPNIRELLREFLAEDYIVEAFETGDALLERFHTAPADLVILDVMMPGTDGFSICARLRRESDIPILLLTAKDMDADCVTGFTMGCDDYFTKPFSPIRLLMRVRSIFAREEGRVRQAAELSFGDLLLRPDSKSALCCGQEIHLTNTECALLALLIENKSRAVSRDELLNQVWGYDSVIETRATDDTVKRLRRKLNESGSCVRIRTVWGYGFRLTEEQP